MGEAACGEKLNTWAVVHSIGGKVGRAGGIRLAESLAPNGGTLQVAWPLKTLATLQTTTASKPYLFGGQNVMEAYNLTARSAGLLAQSKNFQFCPLRPRTQGHLTRRGRPVMLHAMLYALVANSAIRRVVVESMNLSIEALGQFVQGRYDTYSFEVGVALSPIEASSDAPWVVIELAPDGGLGPPVRDIGSLWTNDGTNKRFCRRKKKKKKKKKFFGKKKKKKKKKK